MIPLSIIKLAAFTCGQCAFILHCVFFNLRKLMQSKDEDLDLVQLGQDYLSTSPGFFDPYVDVGDFLITFTLPLTAPFALAAFTAIAAMITVFATLYYLACLIAAAGASLVGADDFCNGALEHAGKAFMVAAIAGICTPIFALMTPLSPVLALLHLFTRTSASVVSAIGNCFGEDEESTESLGEDNSGLTPTFR